MESFIEPIRYTTSIFGVVAVIAVFGVLRRSSRRLLPWAAITMAAGLVFTHVNRGVPVGAMVPAGAVIGLAIAIATLFSKQVRDGFDALDDQQWRSLMLLRSVFGALLLAAGGVGLLPAGFALPAGLGDVLAGALALVVPGSLAANGHRGSRLLVFGVGIIDFANVIALQVLVLVPWLAHGGLGISLVLPWVVVPVLAIVNLHGVRRVVIELLGKQPAKALG